MDDTFLDDLSQDNDLLLAVASLLKKHKKNRIILHGIVLPIVIAGVVILAIFYPYICFLPVLIMIPVLLFPILHFRKKESQEYGSILTDHIVKAVYGHKASYSSNIEQGLTPPEVGTYLPLAPVNVYHAVHGFYQTSRIDAIDIKANYDYLSEILPVRETDFEGTCITCQSPIMAKEPIIVTSLSLGHCSYPRILVDDMAFSKTYRVFSPDKEADRFFTDDLIQRLLDIDRTFFGEKEVILFKGNQVSLLVSRRTRYPGLRPNGDLLENLSKCFAQLIILPGSCYNILNEKRDNA